MIKTAAELALERADQMDELAATRPDVDDSIVIAPTGDDARLVERGHKIFAVVTRPLGSVVLEASERVPRHLRNDVRYLTALAKRLCKELDHQQAAAVAKVILPPQPGPTTIARRGRVADAKDQLKNAAKRRITKKEA